MWLCSGVAHDCKRIVIPYTTFDSYRDCSLYGYEHTVNILNNMPEKKLKNGRYTHDFRVQKKKRFDNVAEMC